MWLDDVTRSAYFEPVGVVPGYQRSGLGKGVFREISMALRYFSTPRWAWKQAPEVNGFFLPIVERKIWKSSSARPIQDNGSVGSLIKNQACGHDILDKKSFSHCHFNLIRCLNQGIDRERPRIQ